MKNKKINLEKILYDFNFENIVKNNYVIAECLDIYDEIECLFGEDEIIEGLYDILYTIYGYQDDEKILTINSMLRDDMNELLTILHDNAITLIKKFNNNLKKEIVSTSNVQDYTARLAKGCEAHQRISNARKGGK